MPKTFNHLWESVIDWDNLLFSYMQARKGKRYSEEVLRFTEQLEENLINIQNHLIWKSWQPGQWREFWVTDPKMRLIQAPPFKDRVVHHAVVGVTEPLFERKMIFDSYACRIDKGTHGATDRLQAMLRKAARNWGKVYVLKADISKYFPSINHDALLRILARTIKDKNALWLYEQIIKGCGYEHRGLPVGALSSQLLANVYLGQLDHKAKDNWGVKFYVRYMDDFVILGPSKDYLWNLLYDIEEFLAIELYLSLNPKTAIYPTNKGIDFAGYRTWKTHKLPRKRNVKRVKCNFCKLATRYYNWEIDLDYIRPRVMSFLGYVKHCSAHRSTKSVLRNLLLTRSRESR